MGVKFAIYGKCVEPGYRETSWSQLSYGHKNILDAQMDRDKRQHSADLYKTYMVFEVREVTSTGE